MKKLTLHILMLFVALLTMAGCKKAETDFHLTPKSVIVFDDDINKISADYSKAGNLNLKIGVTGPATSVRIVSTYNSSTGVAKTSDLGTIPVNNGVAVLNIPAINVRNSADGAVVGAGSNPSSSRTNNTYNLLVDAVNPDGSTERRYFAAVIVQ